MNEWIELNTFFFSLSQSISMEFLISFGAIFGSGLIAWGTLRNKVENHIGNEELHPTHKEISGEMMPRTECNIISKSINSKMNKMEEDLSEIKTDIKTILSRK